MTRQAVAFFNERSVPVAASPVQVGPLVSTLANTIAAARTIRRDLSLVASIPLAHLPVTRDGRSIAALLGSSGGRVREEWRSVLNALNRAPFASFAAPVMNPDYEEFRWDNQLVDGLGIAAAAGQLAISMASAPAWETDSLMIEHVAMLHDGSSLESRQVDLRHASNPVHVEGHAQHLLSSTLPKPFTGSELWAQRAEVLPTIAFLPRVEQDLRAFATGSSALAQILEALLEIDAACRMWVSARGAPPNFGPHITGESATRKHLCTFSVGDGKDRCFDLHARYTPGAGRIHFSPNGPDVAPHATVAYIGPKIEQRRSRL